ncbi:LacI family transcriptional regulator [Shimia abyssi]|uniref:LacI family transcriptional regulator n=1 Tax=Shimia abyssi TaxID=1662395 RepID=A0A2P8F6X1_9RHOB|nr:LacI family transcriptional regulator [Shimia abyssi]PSL17470.1 LacI family transcriptional regulator [Shimia abyssi]
MKRNSAKIENLSAEELRQLVLPGERPTQKTISRISGLAVATVSRALGDAPDIGQSTKEMVRSIADAIGYVPNRAGVRLRTGRTNVITLVVPAEGEVINNSAKLTNSIALELRGTPFHLNALPWFPDEDSLRPIKYIVETHSADAVIFNMTEPRDQRVEYLLKHGFPFATHGRTEWCDKHAYYDYDNQAFVCAALKNLAARGRKNIHAILPPANQNYAQDMIRGLEETAPKLGLAYRIAQNVDSDRSSDAIRHWITHRLTHSPDIDAILCSSSKVAIAAIVAIEQQGLSLGESIDVYTKEVIPLLKMFREDIIVEFEDVSHAGSFLAKAVMRQLLHPDQPLMQHLEIPVATPR